jgi:hypothetical protein
MPKSWLSIFVVLGLALACSVTYAQQPTIPSGDMFRDARGNGTYNYDSFSYPNIAAQQFVPPGEFCVNPPNMFGPPDPGSGLLEPAQILGLGYYCDGPLGGVFGTVTRHRNNDAYHTLTDLQRNNNLLYWYNYQWYNATTTFYPGGFTLTCPTPYAPWRTGGREPQPITSVAGGFVYLGTLTGCCGSCPSPSQGGLGIGFSAATNGGGSGALLLEDRTCCETKTNGIHYNAIMIFGPGGYSSGYMNHIGFFQGIVYALAGGGCKTYSDLKDEILNAVITGNPPSDPPFDSVEGGPYYKHDSGIGGIRNSLWKKAINSEAAFNRGQLNSAGNTLGALHNHCEAQDGKHLDTDSASDLMNCIRSLRGTLGI